MRDFFKILGLVAIIIVAALNLRHAGNNYGLQTNSLWSEVGAQTTSTGGEGGCSGTQCNYVYCLWEKCIGVSNLEECFLSRANDYWECSYLWVSYPDPLNNLILIGELWLECIYQYGEYPECELFEGKKHKCTTIP